VEVLADDRRAGSLRRPAHLERETGWAVIDPAGVVAVVWDSEPKTSAGQALERELPYLRFRSGIAPT